LRRAADIRRQRGVALLLVLIALAVLGAMTVDLMEEDGVYVAATANSRDALKAEYIARSGVNLSRLMLSVQPLLGGQFNFPFWQYADIILEPFTSSGGGDSDSDGDGDSDGDQMGGSMLTDMTGIDLSGAEGLGLPAGEELAVTIVDEDSKIQINLNADQTHARDLAVQQLLMLTSPIQYDELFNRNTGSDGSLTREEIICELIDFADPDEELCDLSGGEDSSYYDTQDAPSLRKNAPYDSLEELHLVHGIGDDFWAAFVDPDPTDPERRVMTVWGKGRVNVNTASAQTLLAEACYLASDESGVSPCGDLATLANLAQIIQGVLLIRTFMPFGTAADFVKAIESPQEVLFMPLTGLTLPNKARARQVLGTRSSVFSIYSEGTVGNARRRIHTVVDMEGLDMLDPTKSVASSGGKVLYWRMD
jgi:general secretion pathway protein K